ncbi:hypothetical protein DSECCO2_417320 [anaerobic digester metagenome]
MKAIVLFIAAILVLMLPAKAQTPDSSSYVSLEKCLQSSSVQFSARCLGGHSGFCIEAKLRNNGSSVIKVMVEPGRRLVADSAEYQDIFIVKAKYITLLPGKEEKVQLYGFCCESSDWGPGVDLKYKAGAMAPPAWVKLAAFINQNNFPDNAVQHAIWVMSNNHDIAGVDCNNREQTIALRKMLCDLTGKEMPWATVNYKQDSTMVFTGVINRIRGDIQYYVRYNCPVTIVLTDNYGRLIKTLMEPTIQGIGRYTFTLDLDVSDYPSGDYEVRIYEDGAILLDRRKFAI